MGIIANLVRATGRSVRKFSVTQGAITGTGSIATGLTTVDTGGNFGSGNAGTGAVATAQNSATTIPTTFASISSITGGSVAIVCVALAAAANTISAVATNVNVWAVGT